MVLQVILFLRVSHLHSKPSNDYTDAEVSAEKPALRVAGDDALSLRATSLEGRMDTAENRH